MKQLMTMAFIRSEKPYEKRIAILPEDMSAIQHLDQLYFEEGYGKDFSIDDEEYTKLGCHVVSKQIALKQDILCDTKIGEASYLATIADHKTLVGWIHAGADPALTDTLLVKQHTCYAWEDLYDKKRQLFWQNNQIAGAGGVMNALQYTGFLPYGKKAGIIGRGDSAAGAFSMLTNLGAEVRQYTRSQEALFVDELPQFDIIVMAVRWDTQRNDYIISSQERKKMKKDCIIVDISDDVDGPIEHSKSTSIKNPIYYLDDIMVYSVCNVPSIYFKTATKGLSMVMKTLIDDFVEQRDNMIIQNSKIIDHGEIIDQRISLHQHRS